MAKSKAENQKKLEELNSNYESKLRQLSLDDEIDGSRYLFYPYLDEKENVSKIIELQVEENKSLRKVVEDLINNNNPLHNQSLQEKSLELTLANDTISKLTEKLTRYEKKLKEAKVYHRLFRHSQTVQCKYCSKFYPSNGFLSHSQICAIGETSTCDKINLSGLAITITQTVIKEDENLRKPFTIYVIEVKLDGDTWIVQRKYKEFCNLHEELTKYFPNITFPTSASQFENKTLGDIMKKKKTAAVEDRRKVLQKYLNGLAQIPIIRDSQFFTDFIDIS